MPRALIPVLAALLAAACSAHAPPGASDARALDASDALDGPSATDVVAMDASDRATPDAAEDVLGDVAQDSMDGAVNDAMDATADDVTDDTMDATADDTMDATADDAPSGDDVSTACPPPDFDAASWDGGAAPTLAADIQPIFNAHCSCHQTGAIEPYLDRSRAYSSLYCAPAAVGCPSASVRVLPGDPSHSALYQRVAGTDCYDRMPLDGPYLSDAEIALIHDWIASGAAP